jgi:hypothetical protein
MTRFLTDEEQIRAWINVNCNDRAQQIRRDDIEIKDDCVRVNSTLNISNDNLKEILVQFSFSKNFYCYNTKLTTLVGSPIVVQGNFECSDTAITSLKGPELV